MKYAQLDIADLERETAALAQRYSAVSDSNLSLDLTRGKPAPDQLDLSNTLDGILEGEYVSASGIDARNYGDLRGLPEARQLGAEILGLDAMRIIADGPSSLTLMYQVMDVAFHYGLSGPAWVDDAPVKAICPVPGYDRHFTITESFGVEMVSVPMTATGPDMDRVEGLVEADPSIKCIWCVPKYSNPSGCVYSPETVRRIATLGNRASAGFIVLWDNAYAVHDFEFPPAILDDVLARAEESGTADNVVVFGSTSKITFAGGGVSFVAGSPKTLDKLEARLSVMLIGHDKGEPTATRTAAGWPRRGAYAGARRPGAAQVRSRGPDSTRVSRRSRYRRMDATPRRLFHRPGHDPGAGGRSGGPCRARRRAIDPGRRDASLRPGPRRQDHPAGTDVCHARGSGGGNGSVGPVHSSRERAANSRR